MIHDFINDICGFLEIDPPEISNDISRFQSGTTLAQCAPDGSAIYIKCGVNPNLDLYFAVTHELRHVWQIRSGDETFFNGYKTVDMCDTLEEYNLQLAEVDANAFAGVVMVDLFGVKPLFNGLSDAVRAKIYERMRDIAI